MGRRPKNAPPQQTIAEAAAQMAHFRSEWLLKVEMGELSPLELIDAASDPWNEPLLGIRLYLPFMKAGIKRATALTIVEKMVDDSSSYMYKGMRHSDLTTVKIKWVYLTHPSQKRDKVAQRKRALTLAYLDAVPWNEVRLDNFPWGSDYAS